MSHIVTDAMKAGPDESHAVSAAIKKLNTLLKVSKTAAEYLEQLNIIKAECDKGMQYKVLAGESTGTLQKKTNVEIMPFLN